MRKRGNSNDPQGMFFLEEKYPKWQWGLKTSLFSPVQPARMQKPRTSWKMIRSLATVARQCESWEVPWKTDWLRTEFPGLWIIPYIITTHTHTHIYIYILTHTYIYISIWLVVWNIFIFPYLENNSMNPNWLTHIFQRGSNHQPDISIYSG